MIVLDASALLALLFREPGHEQVAKVLDDALISTVNLSEVLGRFTRDGHPASAVLNMLQSSAITWIDFDFEHATVAAKLLPQTKALGLSFGDRACLALGVTQKMAVMTADRIWLSLAPGIDVRTIR